MSKEIKLSIDNGNSKTVIVEDAAAAKFFWSDYFTQSYEASNDHFVFENSFDLMGNLLPKSKPARQHSGLLSKK
jgi:hypothetical protein